MHRRQFFRASLAPAMLACAAAAGCSDSSRETGTMVTTPPEDLKSMEASAEAYKAMSKGKKK